jgi:hypothetical protein
MVLDLDVGVTPDAWPGPPAVLALSAGDDALARVWALPL